MIYIVVAILIVLVLGQLLTWYGLYVVAGFIQREIHRQDDRIRRRVERQGENEDSDKIESLVDIIRAENLAHPDEDYSDLLDRYPDARMPSDFEEL